MIEIADQERPFFFEDLKIREYKSTDLPKMQKLEQICFPPGQAFDRQTLLSLINDFNSIVLCMIYEPDDLIGFLIFSEIELNVWELMTIEIHPKAQGKGFGYKLLFEGMSIVEKREPRIILLHVSSLNENAIKLYTKFGFYIVKSIQNYYNIGQSAYLMHKEFSND
jgi:ribosomal-protein-alanine N-acetyltransferase